jgi:flagellar biosynthetic protein FlhB
MEDSETDKTERATPYKLERSREKGIVARGLDLGFMASLLAFFCYFWIARGEIAGAVAHAAREALVGGPDLADGALIPASAALISEALVPLILLFAVLFGVVLLVEIVQTGMVFSGEPFGPDFTRLNPVNGFKRVFSLRAFVEALKNILKLAVYATLGYLIVTASLKSEQLLVSDARSLFAMIQESALRLLALFLLGAVFFAVLDQIIVRNMFARRMRMSRRELRRELREREGEPRLKNKRRQLHRELARSSQSLRNLRKADVLVTNPEHIAVALQYDSKTMVAPAIVSIGVNHFAQRLKGLAFLYNVPIVENRALAQALVRKATLNGTIPAECFRPVADIYNTLRARLRKTEESHV